MDRLILSNGVRHNKAMAWITLAEATSLEEFEATVPPITELDKGTRLKLRIELPEWAPIGKLADIASAEFWAQWLGPEGVTVIDVYGDWYWIEMTAEVDPPLGTLALIAIIAAAIAVLPFSIALLIAAIKLSAEQVVEVAPGIFKWLAIGLGGAAAFGGIIFLLTRPTVPETGG